MKTYALKHLKRRVNLFKQVAKQADCIHTFEHDRCIHCKLTINF